MFGEHLVITFNSFGNSNEFKVFFRELLFLQWRRDVAFARFEVPIQMNVSTEKNDPWNCEY